MMNKRLIGFIIGSIAGLIVIATATVLALQMVIPKETVQPNTTPNSQTLQMAVDPEIIIADYIAADIDGRSAYSQRKETDSKQTTTPVPVAGNVTVAPTNGVIVYESIDRYDTQISVMDRAQYERTDGGTKNTGAIASATEAFLIEQKFTRIGTSSPYEGLNYTNFDSQNVYCQVTDVAATPEAPSLYGLACVSKRVITLQYEAIDALITLVPEIDESKINTISISPQIVEGDKKLAALTVTRETNASFYYFGAIGDEWEYLGERPATNPDDAASFALPAELKAAMADAKWGNFLTTYIR